MICAECNGKGYRIGKEGEEVCSECQGKGELQPFQECLAGLQSSRLCEWGLAAGT